MNIEICFNWRLNERYVRKSEGNSKDYAVRFQIRDKMLRTFRDQYIGIGQF